MTEAEKEQRVGVLLDTSYLLNPDRPAWFKRLLEHSRDDRVDLLIPRVVWEEWRTHIAEEAMKVTEEAALRVKELNKLAAPNRLIQVISPVVVEMPTRAEIDSKSKAEMEIFAREYRPIIHEVQADHSQRVLERYFSLEPIAAPFNPNVERTERRKDFPDAFILEAGIDLKAQYPRLQALCKDKRLATALNAEGINAHSNTESILKEIEQSDLIAKGQPELALRFVQTTTSSLETALASAEDQFRELERRVVGYVAYFDAPSKNQLFDMLLQSGVNTESARNAAERLALAGVIRDTGSHYLVVDKALADESMPHVEAEIIALLGKGS